MITDAMYRQNKTSKSVEELFIPVRSESESAASERCAVLLATRDPGLITLYQQIESSRSKEEAIGYLEHHKNKFVNREIKGLVKFGIDLKDEERRKLASLDKSLTTDFVILTDGKEPSMGAGIGMLLGGIVLAGLGVLGVRRSG
jgi:hypothetical protein